MGIDPSINCTGVCICGIEDNPIYILIPSKCTKKMKSFKHDRIYIEQFEKTELKDLTNEEKEFAKSRNIYNIVYIIERLVTIYKVRHVVMEGVAYNATGSVVDLAGLNYAIRMMLLRHNIDFTIITPNTVKKFAVANGGADKELMIYAWQKLEPELKNIKEFKVDDLADAYFMAQWGCAEYH